MRNPFSARPPEYAVQELTLDDVSAVTRLHEEYFARPWSEAEFEALLVQDAVSGFSVRQVGNPKIGNLGFVLVRQAADEAEILTIAVTRPQRCAGLGRMLMEAVLRRLHADRVEALFLEVDETNLAALALYRRLGFREVGRRDGYYSDREGRKTSALVMRRDLR